MLTQEQLAQRLASEPMAKVLDDLVRERVEAELERQKLRRRLYSRRELEEMGWPAGRLRYWLEEYREQLIAAGAVVPVGRSVLMDPERMEQVMIEQGRGE